MHSTEWMKNYRKRCRRAINEFKKIVKENKYLNDSMNTMIKEIPHKIDKHCDDNYKGYSITEHNKKPKNFDEVCKRFYNVITHAPKFYDPLNPFNGLPVIDLFAKLIASDTGLLFFGNIVINNHMKKILDLWSGFLMRPESAIVLTKNGWLGMSSMDEFKHNKNKKHYGFKSWNDFFIRQFKDIDKSRPMSDALVVSACDAIYVAFKKNIKYSTDFMRVKGDIYSLKDMLFNVPDNIVKKFVGGCIYQAYLSAETYHRYHSPVEGKLVHADVVDGSLFLVNNFYEKNENKFCGQDQVMKSQQFLPNVQTRGICIFKTKEIGYVGFIAIGMTEVSSCIIYDNLLNKVVKKGQEIGHFQYGGSSHLLIFEKKYMNKLKFSINRKTLTKLRSKIACLK